MKFSLSLIAFCCVAISSHADVRVPALFSDHAVLQRDSAVPVWGWADVGEEVTASVAGQSQSAKADANGKWMVKFKELKAGGPHVLTIKSSNNTITVNDVLVGEVWLGSGQSNMAMTVSKAKDFDAEKVAATNNTIRMFTERSGTSSKAQQECKGTWSVCSPESVGGYSATLYFFGREVQRELQVPMGLINSSVGGTPIESWIDSTTQHAKPELKGFFDAKSDGFDEEQTKALYQRQLDKWIQDVKAAKSKKQPLPRKPRDPLEVRARKSDVGGLFNGKIAPLIPYAIRGLIWYQGEANAQPEKAPFYSQHLSLLVQDWRQRWGNEFPAAWVQLPNLNGRGDSWCEVREKMFQTLRVPKTGMAVTIDIGDDRNIHPANKQEVGRRLSLWALGTVYGKTTAVSGPRFTGLEQQGGKLKLSFTHTDGGLLIKGEAKDFVVAGEDKQWHNAAAVVEGNSVLVSSPSVAKPIAVRYAWSEVPAVNLWNGAGLPASPFRSDNWPLNYAAAARAKK